MKQHSAYFTYDEEADAYYFAPSKRTAPPYTEQRIVQAIIDVASDGTLAGIEILDMQIQPPGNVKQLKTT